MQGPWRSPMAWALSGLVAAYRATAPFRSPRCRFYPSCSTYALESLRVHGAARGGWLSIRRISRCHPWNPGGVDHPPRADAFSDRAGGVQAPALDDGVRTDRRPNLWK